MGDLILSMKGITKSFSGVAALKIAALDLKAGEVVALMGENGAGKSTLMKILTGIYSKDSGEIQYMGQEVCFKGPAESEEAGISIVHQELNMMNDLTVAQNLYIGREEMNGFLIDDKKMNEKAGAKVVLDVGIPAEVKDVDAAAVASAILEKKDLIAIYGSNEFAANAIITANEGLDKLGADKVIAVGFDAGKKLLDAVRAKTFAGAVTQDPVQIGYQAVKLAVEAADGKSVSDVDTGAKWYNADNMDADDIKPCLYE